MDLAAAAFIARGLLAHHAADDHTDGLSQDALRALIDEAEASGPEEVWDAAAAKALRRYASRRA